jgi:hypothetical protein
MARVRGGLGWAVVVGLIVYTAAAGLGPIRPAGADRAPVQAVGGMIVEGVEGRWVENAGGSLYVVGGWLRADPAQAPEPGVQLRVRLVDSHGVAPVSVSSALGPPLRAEQLRESRLPDLREAHERRALRMAWQRLRTGERRAFQAIFAEVPATATAFEFQAVPAASPPLEPSEPPAPPFPATEPIGEVTAAPTG